MERFDEFESLIEKYIPVQGQGNTMASQIVAAYNKLVYKWFNDGDVFDNRYNLEGWANDLSSYANWLSKYTKKAESELRKISECYTEAEYSDLLYGLGLKLMQEDFLEEMNKLEAVGDIYNCEGDYAFEEYQEEEEEY